MNGTWRFAASVLAVAALSCYQGDPGPSERKTVENHDGVAASDDVDSREQRAAERIMEVLEKYSVMTAVNIDAHFWSDGNVSDCKVESRYPERFLHGAEREALVDEVCEIVSEVGKPTPPPSLSYKVSFSAPLLGPKPEEPIGK
jgi:hypothetical protein